jgi:DNA-binding MarR family transcriptional regulator
LSVSAKIHIGEHTPREGWDLPRSNSASNGDGEVDGFVSAILGASWVMVGMSARSLAEVDDSLTVTQFRTLAVLGRDGSMNLQHLADVLQVNASTAMRMVDRLVNAGLVSRQENPATRREVILDVTPAGRRIFDDVMKRRRDEVREIVTRMPKGDRKVLISALRSFVEAGGGDPRATHGALGW